MHVHFVKYTVLFIKNNLFKVIKYCNLLLMSHHCVCIHSQISALPCVYIVYSIFCCLYINLHLNHNKWVTKHFFSKKSVFYYWCYKRSKEKNKTFKTSLDFLIPNCQLSWKRRCLQEISVIPITIRVLPLPFQTIQISLYSGLHTEI